MGNKAFEKYRKKKILQTKPSARNSHTSQKIINSWLLGDKDKGKKKKKDKDKDKDKDKRKGKGKGKSKGNPFDRNRSRGGGGKGNAGKGGGPAKGPSNEKGLSFYEGTEGMTPAEFELYKQIKLRGIDSENANKLQNIINSGKTEVALIQRDASIYGALVSGFW